MQLKQSLNTFLHSKGFLFISCLLCHSSFHSTTCSRQFFPNSYDINHYLCNLRRKLEFLGKFRARLLGHAVFLGIGGFASAIIGSSISKATVSFLGTTQMPVGGFICRYFNIGTSARRLAFSRSWVADRFSLHKIEGMVSWLW